jgi:8-oxo-dGTP pyrophosphatase MutT (NUDIX family)
MMPRQAFEQLLRNYTPSPAESAFKPDMQNLLHDYPDCFSRTLIPPGHFTSSAWLLGHQGDKVLLTHHAILNRWLQPGGHADGDPDLLNGALREAEEESGLDRVVSLLPHIFDIDVHDIPENSRRNEAAHKHYDVRFLLYTDQIDYALSDESHDLGWFDLSELQKLDLDVSVHRMIGKWQSLIKDGSLPTLIKQAQQSLENFN